MRIAGTSMFESSSSAFLKVSTGSWTRSGAGRTSVTLQYGMLSRVEAECTVPATEKSDSLHNGISYHFLQEMILEVRCLFTNERTGSKELQAEMSAPRRKPWHGSEEAENGLWNSFGRAARCRSRTRKDHCAILKIQINQRIMRLH